MTLSEYAKSWIGKNFAGSATEQCMLFVRHCLTEVNAPIKNTVTKEAVDGLDTSYALASSLAGRDCGYLFDTMTTKANDIIFFKNTYGNWDDGVITHVGIIVDSNGNFVHRPTSIRPVELAQFHTGYWREHFRCVLRWEGVKPQVTSREMKWFMHDKGSSLLINKEPGGELTAANASFTLTNSGPQININNKNRKLKWAQVHLGFED